MLSLFSPLHIFLIIMIFPVYFLGMKYKEHTTLIYIISFILFLLEIIKQIYYITHHIWTVWIFPFQLCSIPLYYFLFFRSESVKKYLESFTAGYILLGGVFAILFPEDMIKADILLTLHSFIWHYLLIFISGICINKSNITNANIVFFICIGIASMINIFLGKYGEINMFYISPLYPTTQPVFSLITNIHLKNICYIGCLMTGATIINLFQIKKAR